jgi:hypothetical protein
MLFGSDYARVWTAVKPWFDSQQAQEILLLAEEFRTALGPNQLIQGIPGTLHAGIKWQGREADHLLPHRMNGAIHLLLHMSCRRA